MGQTDVEYYINGVNFEQYGVYVAASSGVTSKLQMKDPLSVDWDNYHGVTLNLNKPRFKERVITLDCFIAASGFDDFKTKYRAFIAQFEKKGTQRFKIDVGNTPLVYEVYCPDSVEISKQWNPAQMVGTFKIKLVEPEPVKKVLRGSGSVSIRLTSSKLVNIYWGDGTYTFDVSGNAASVGHTYSGGGTYEIIITGVIEDISSFETNATVLWDKLM